MTDIDAINDLQPGMLQVVKRNVQCRAWYTPHRIYQSLMTWLLVSPNFRSHESNDSNVALLLR